MQIRLLVSCLYILATTTSFSQDLLSNGGFEEENICTEYQVNCSPESWVTNKDGFSTYINDSSSAWQGKRYVAIEVGHTTKVFQRTFYRTRLLCGLRQGHRYKLEFYVKSPLTILDSIGILFTSYDFLYSKQKLHNIAPTMFIKPTGGSFVNDSNWQKISMEYTAAGDESFLTIASFCKRDIKGGGLSSGGHFFVFIDEMSLVPLDPRERLCSEAATNKQDNYDQDERHEMLRNKVRQNNDDPPVVVMPPMRIRIVDTLVLPDVLFASGKADLKQSSYSILDDFCRRVAVRKIDSIVVEGHTDNTGIFSFNEKLSLDRANTSKAAIQQRLARFRPLVITRGWADKRPVSANTSAAGRQRNRRVELFVYASE